ncbi:putative quinol monooxygenase [Pseudonocardia spinosispora]|uniref:putative quinol monooxygenase n=1 Tax=Pseudonocardia spinosispora TaxID=103441 RepID=UPI00041D12C5|nr:putative quinol monooxygenase [Pseudonocardia spinosispora]
MIFIVVKFTARPEYSDQWLSEVDEFTKATRAEPGNIFFEWSKSVDTPHQYVLVEAFQDDAAEAHVTSDHFKKAVSRMSELVATTPEIINVQGVPASGWSEMGEIQPQG